MQDAHIVIHFRKRETDAGIMALDPNSQHDYGAHRVARNTVLARYYLSQPCRTMEHEEDISFDCR